METLFQCGHCGHRVSVTTHGTRHRNHCPVCLWSKHLDHMPGDRSSECHGLMEPIAVSLSHKDEWAVVHRCVKCGHLASNRIAPDDDELVLLALVTKPLSKPPFPLEYLARAIQQRSNGT